MKWGNHRDDNEKWTQVSWLWNGGYNFKSAVIKIIYTKNNSKMANVFCTRVTFGACFFLESFLYNKLPI